LAGVDQRLSPCPPSHTRDAAGAPAAAMQNAVTAIVVVSLIIVSPGSPGILAGAGLRTPRIPPSGKMGD